MELARILNLDEKQFDSCLSSGKYRTEVERDLQDGIKLGVLGTPGIFINGIPLSGAQSEAAFEHIIQAELAAFKGKHADP